MASQIEGQGKVALHVVEAIEQTFAHFAEQEIVPLQPGRRPVPVAAQRAPVENDRKGQVNASWPLG